MPNEMMEAENALTGKKVIVTMKNGIQWKGILLETSDESILLFKKTNQLTWMEAAQIESIQAQDAPSTPEKPCTLFDAKP